jgi:hypothetical protein
LNEEYQAETQNVLQMNKIFHVDCKGFWQSCLKFRIAGFLDFIHCPVL